MTIQSNKAAALAMCAALALPATAAYAQELDPADAAATSVQNGNINVIGSLPTDLEGLAEGPELEGFVSSRRGNTVEVTGENGQTTAVLLAPTTDIRARGGFLGLSRTSLGADALLNGIPVSVETVQWEGGLVASRVRFSNEDLETAQMIASGTNQRFSANEMAIDENTAATEANAAAAEALRGRVANIDQYNVYGSTNVYFDTGRWNLSSQAEADLCRAAAEANETENALLLVVGYTDDVGDRDFNQVLSERRAGRVVNYLQQECGWQPWRMLSPTGMAESDPAADNTTAAGRAQNRRVSVNILVSKAVDGIGG